MQNRLTPTVTRLLFDESGIAAEMRRDVTADCLLLQVQVTFGRGGFKPFRKPQVRAHMKVKTEICDFFSEQSV